MVLFGINEAYNKLIMYNRRQAAIVSIPRLLKLCDNCQGCYNGKYCWHFATAGFPFRSDGLHRSIDYWQIMSIAEAIDVRY